MLQKDFIDTTQELKVSNSFNVNDLKTSLQLVKNFHGIPVYERTLQSEDERIEKYLSLQDLNSFLQDVSSAGKDGSQAAQLLENRSILAKISKEISEKQRPLEYDSDEDVMYAKTVGPLAQNEHDYEDLDIFQERVDENGQLLKALDFQGMSNEDQVKNHVAIVMDLLKKECGKSGTKKLNLGDTISTKIETSVIIQQHLITEEQLTQIERKSTLIYGNVKAMIPLMRERLTVEFDDLGKSRYKRGVQVPLTEKRIFGILTKYQVGHIPSVDISFTEDEETFLRDTYIFKSLISKDLHLSETQNLYNSSESCQYFPKKEMWKIRAVNDYSREAIANEEVDQFVQVGTLNQIETFHQFLMNDLYRQEKAINFQKAFLQGREMDKKYYIIPLKKVKYQADSEDKEEYRIDRKLMEKVERISIHGYKKEQSHINKEMEEKGIKGESRFQYMKENILVKEDKPHRCYHYFQMFEDLKNMSAEDFAVAIKGKPENLSCTTAYDLLFIAGTRFQSIYSFRECLSISQEDSEMIKTLPIMLLDPAKIISHRKFKYNLEQCPKNIINKKQVYKKDYREKQNLTTSQGKPIFTSYNIYRHYLTLEQWDRAAQLPLVMLFFERSLYCHQLVAELGVGIHPEFMLWATSAVGVWSSRKSYQTLETYGDTIIKLGATLASFEYYKSHAGVDESTIDRLKIAFLTNLYLLRIGKRLKLNRYIRATTDPDLKTYQPPFSEQVSATEVLNCNGKHIADVVESILGAHFMSNNLRRTLQLIAEMQIIPLDKMGILESIPDRDLTFILHEDIDAYGFQIEDTVNDIYQRYFQVHGTPENIQEGIFKILDKDGMNAPFMSAHIDFLQNQENLRDIGTRNLELKLIELLQPVEKILNYSFKDKSTLLEAFTHKSFKDYHNLNKCYEKLEILGDAILDYVANSNLIKYTILEKYNLQERLQQTFITQEDFQPFDAHQAKSLLTKNDFLAKLVCLFGFHKYIMYYKPKVMTRQEMREQLAKEGGGALEEWKITKKIKEQMNEKDADKFIKYSFRRNFMINGRETELFEAPKILGDVFEAIIGAVFVDGGIEKVLEVFQHLLSPFILYTAKYSKKLYKEPKEDFILRSNQLKIKPIHVHTDIELDSLDTFMTYLHDAKEVEKTYSVVDKKRSDEQEQAKYKMIRCDIKFNGNEIMTTGYGNTKKQAERNASIEGQKWLLENKINNQMMMVCQ